MLTRFIRDENRKPFGIIVAVQLDDGSIHYGVSLNKPGDKWNRDLGRKIAIGRAYSGTIMPELPRKKEDVVIHQLGQMMKQAKHYFERLSKKKQLKKDVLEFFDNALNTPV